MDYSDIFVDKTKKAIIAISKYENVSFDKKKAQTYFQNTCKAKLIESIEVVRKDTLQAGFGLTDNKDLTSIQKSVMMLSLDHFCTMYAKDIFDNSK